MITAAFRARDTERADGVCHDPWAGRLAGEEAVALAESAARRVPEAEFGVALRTRFFDHQLERWTEAGGRQVVLLGAGLDTRAARLNRTGVRFFEVDHPTTQEDKRRRVEALGDYPVDAATYVPCNFETTDFLDALIDAGLDASAPSLVLWEGVTAFLSEEAVKKTLERVATGFAPASVLVFDYLTDVRGSGDTGAHVRGVATEAGEPLRFVTDAPLPLLHQAGFRRVQILSMEEVCRTITGGYDPARRMLSMWGIAIASCEAQPQNP